MNNKTNTKSNDSVKPAVALVVIAVVATLYFWHQYLLPQFEYDQKLDHASQALMAKSPAHKLLIERYLNCRANSYRNNSRVYCISEVQKLSEAEGVQDKFEEVYADIKNELWKIKKDH